MTLCATQAALDGYMSEQDRLAMSAAEEAREARLNEKQRRAYIAAILSDYSAANEAVCVDFDDNTPVDLSVFLLCEIGADAPQDEFEAARRYWRMRNVAMGYLEKEAEGKFPY